MSADFIGWVDETPYPGPDERSDSWLDPDLVARAISLGSVTLPPTLKPGDLVSIDMNGKYTPHTGASPPVGVVMSTDWDLGTGDLKINVSSVNPHTVSAAMGLAVTKPEDLIKMIPGV